MASADLSEWIVEQIPDSDRLFLRVHVNMLVNGKLHPGVFRENKGSMSTDWEKYSTPAECCARSGDAARNGVIDLVAGIVRAIQGLAVEHSPDKIRVNRAHTDVLGVSGANKTRARLLLFKRFQAWVIPPKASAPGTSPNISL